jgi:hypothetical protein
MIMRRFFRLIRKLRVHRREEMQDPTRGHTISKRLQELMEGTEPGPSKPMSVATGTKNGSERKAA